MGPVLVSESPAAPASIELRDGWLLLRVAGERELALHERWLRIHCDLDRHPETRERTLDSSELPDDLRATHARVDGDALEVQWSHGGRRSRYALAWLEEHAPRAREHIDPPPSEVAKLELSWRGPSLAPLLPTLLERLEAHGAVVVRREGEAPPPEAETEAWIEALGATGLRVIGTHFGRIEDLRTDNTTNQNTDQLGYTNAAVDVHTDQPFLDHPPRYQLLQGIRAATRGGENALVDVRAVARYLDATDAHTAGLLRSTPVHFHRKQKAFESLVVAPILSDAPGKPLVRYSYFTAGPPPLPFERLPEWFRAYDRFGRLVRNPAHQYRFALRPGDAVLYDNHRMLHARTSFEGPRWVRGVYFDAA